MEKEEREIFGSMFMGAWVRNFYFNLLKFICLYKFFFLFFKSFSEKTSVQAKRYDISTLNRIYTKNKNFINIVGFIAQEPCCQQDQQRGRSP